MSRQDADRAAFSFSAPSLADHRLRVLSFQGTEAMNTLFHFDIELLAESPDLPLEEMLLQPATLTLHGQLGTRQIHGVIESFSLCTVGRASTQYRAVLRPFLLPLAYRKDSRCFQQCSVPELVEQIFRAASLPLDRLKCALFHPYPVREYCVQYQETDLNFLLRLLESEGITLYFEHIDGNEICVLSDGPHAHNPIPGDDALVFGTAGRSTQSDERFVRRCEAKASVHSGRMVLREYRSRQPDLLLEATAESPERTQLEHYIHTEGHETPVTLERQARLHLETHQASSLLLESEGSCRTWLPGHTYALSGHPRGGFNGDWLVLHVVHQGTQPESLEGAEGASEALPSYVSRCTSMEASRTYRPERITPRPNLGGLVSAEVVGPSGHEVYCDQEGRIRVQLHWDRQGKKNEQSTCWLRVSQSWAGAGYGLHVLPRVGQEVLVQFLDGDPDRPLVVGSAHNGKNPAPVSLPTQQTRLTLRTHSTPGGGGFNELSFEDQKGQEDVLLRAERDFHVNVLNDQHRTVGRDDAVRIQQNHTLEIGQNELHRVHQAQDIQIDGSATLRVEQDRTEHVRMNRTLRVLEGHDETDVCQGHSTLRVHADHDVHVQQGDDTLTVAQGSSRLCVQQDRIEEILEGNHLIEVVRGTSQLTAAGSLELRTRTGSGVLRADAGPLTLCGADETRLESVESALLLHGKTQVQLHSQGPLHIEATEVQINASQRIRFQVGRTLFELNESGCISKSDQLSNRVLGIHSSSASRMELS